MGFNPRLEKGGRLPSEGHQPWFHIRQNKHHRWSLDEDQVEQYHLGGALHPHIRWWEAMDVPRKAIQFVEVAELVLTTLVCEDLAHNDDIAQLIRSVGPTLVMNLLLDGPQLPSRWTARYASVLADDPGSAVLTLTSYGMVERSRPHGRDASRVIALWKDPTRGVREIPLEPGAQGVLLTICMDRATRYSADGRWPVDNSTSCYGVAVRQVRAASAGLTTHRAHRPPRRPRRCWNSTSSPSSRPGPRAYRKPRPTPPSASTCCWPRRARAPPGEPSWASRSHPPDSPTPSNRSAEWPEPPRYQPAPSLFDALLTAAKEDHPGETTLDEVVRRALLSMLEERRTRQPTEDRQALSQRRSS